MCQLELKFPFHFQIQFKLGLNLQKSYQFEYCSRIHMTSSVGFLNSSSNHEKYKTNNST
jgi:hypothetical protein